MSVIEEMKRLSAAEEFFELLDVSYDPAVMNRARLHILRRMGQFLAGGLDDLDEEAATDRARALLAGAYAEFVGVAPIEKRLFKVLADRDPARPKARGAFVPLSDLLPIGGNT